jgi:Zn-dependent protease/predicted transcriptional regulator
MNNSMRIFRVFGIDIKLHFTWWFVFALITWSLASSFFPHYFPDLSKQTYWVMGATASLLLFLSVLLHELSHSLVAKAKHIKVESITLFFFGGVAGITKEDMKPSSEFLMAIAGPIFSLLLAGFFFLIYKFNGNIFWTAITYYLWQLNLILAIFNMIPGFPLDGGRAFRAVLHWYYKDLKKATRIAVAGGKFFAAFLFFLGVFGLISGTGAGLWFIFLGGFLYFIAGASYEQVIVRETLSDIPLKDLMDKKFVSLKPEMSFIDFVKKFENTSQDVFVVQDKKFAGILNLNKIQKMPVKMQQLVKLNQVALPFHQVKSLRKDDNAYVAFRKFAEQGLELLPVLDNGKLIGIVTRNKIMHRLVWELKFNGSRKLGKRVEKAVKKSIKKKKQ